MMTQTSPRLLAQLALDHDRGAWATLVERFVSAMHRAAGAAAPGFADDAVQEVAIQLPAIAGKFTARPGDDQEVQVRRWLVRITVNAALSLQRKDTRRHRRERAMPTIVPSTRMDQEWEQPLALALAELPERIREPIVLRYFAGCDDAELAAAMRCRPGTARMRLSRALDQLRGRIGAPGALSVSMLTDRLSAVTAAVEPLPAESIQRFTALVMRHPAPTLPLRHLLGEALRPRMHAGLVAAAIAVVGSGACLLGLENGPAPRPVPVVERHEAVSDPTPPPLVADPGPEKPGDAKVAAAELNAFSSALWAEVAKTPGNLFLSGYSAHQVLAMTMQGAAGATRSQMQRALGFPDDATHLVGDLQALRESLQAKRADGLELVVANAIFGATGYPWRDDFIAGSQRSFAATFAALDLATAWDASRRHINAWVMDHTNQRIANLIPPGPRDPTAMVLVNSVFFKAQWDHPFADGMTSPGDFTTSTGKEEVRYMHCKAVLGCRVGDLTMVALPYRGGTCECLLVSDRVVPGRVEDAPVPGDWMEHITAQRLEQERAHLSPTWVELALPRLHIAWGGTLKQPLQALGMSDAFAAGRADFSGMLDLKKPAGQRGELHIDDVLTKTFLDVDEAGTEAAAATAVVMGAHPTAVLAFPEPLRITFDHRLLLVIRHIETGAILFMGRVEDPGSGRGGPASP